MSLRGPLPLLVIAALATALAVMVVVARPNAGPERAGTDAVLSIAPGTLTPGDRLPQPKGPVVLRVTGLPGGPKQLDLATLDAMPRVRTTLYEPFDKREMTFEGVLLSDLLDILEIPAGTGNLAMRALDGYSVTLDPAALRSEHAVLATRSGGKPIALGNGGPIRVVFPSGEDLGANEDHWIWSVDRMKALP